MVSWYLRGRVRTDTPSFWFARHEYRLMGRSPADAWWRCKHSMCHAGVRLAVRNLLLDAYSASLWRKMTENGMAWAFSFLTDPVLSQKTHLCCFLKHPPTPSPCNHIPVRSSNFSIAYIPFIWYYRSLLWNVPWKHSGRLRPYWAWFAKCGR